MLTCVDFAERQRQQLDIQREIKPIELQFQIHRYRCLRALRQWLLTVLMLIGTGS